MLETEEALKALPNLLQRLGAIWVGIVELFNYAYRISLNQILDSKMRQQEEEGDDRRVKQFISASCLGPSFNVGEWCLLSKSFLFP